MTRTVQAALLSTAALFAVLPAASAETVLEQAAEHRFQLDFHVNDAALQKMLPQGWEPLVATQGPAKDANLRLIFIDRMSIVGADGKQKGRGAERMAYLAIPVKQTSGMGTGQMIIAGLTEDTGDVPGAFGNYLHATTAKVSRSTASAGGAVEAQEDWEFSGATEIGRAHV